ncbi:MAG TPA: TIM barrel protein [Thermoproteota archaeon]|nr:TIM barrel protein [Thermoproteota archaeon]
MSKYPFKVGIVHFMAFPETLDGSGPIPETVQVIVDDDFFDLIEISSVKSASVRRTLSSILSSSGKGVVFCGGGNLIRGKVDLNSLDSSVRKKAVLSAEDLVDEALAYGAKTFVLCSGPDSGPPQRREAKSALIASLSEICDHAGRRTMVSLESFDRDVDKKRLIGPTREAVELVLETRQRVSNIGLTVDLSHLPLLNEKPSYSLGEAKEVLVHSHIGNCMPNADSHPRFGFPGGCNGLNELKEFLQALKSIGYFSRPDPIVSFEVKPTPEEDPKTVIAESKAVLDEAVRAIA